MKHPVKVMVGVVLFLSGTVELVIRSGHYAGIFDFVSFLGICAGIVMFTVGVDKGDKL